MGMEMDMPSLMCIIKGLFEYIDKCDTNAEQY